MNKILIFAFVTYVVALPNPEVEDKVHVMKKDCANGILNPTCLKFGALTLIEKLNSKDEIDLIPGVSLVKDADKSKFDTVAADLARSMSSEPDERLDKFLLYHFGSFLDTHSVKLKLLDDSAVEDAEKAVEEGRRRRRRGGLAALMGLAVMMKGTLMTMGLGALALLAGKALVTALMSLVLSAIVGLKSLAGAQKSTTYEIVSKPIYSHSHSHSTAHEDVGGYGHTGYGRNLNVRKR